jgi:hypothetical protein
MNSIVNAKQFVASRLGIPYENLSQSYLQKGVALGTQSVINFPIQTSQVASPLVTDNLLNLNDEFVVTGYTVFLRTVAADSPSNTQLLNAVPYTYNDTNVFTGTNSVNVGAVFNGTLSFTIDRRISYLHILAAHFYVPVIHRLLLTLSLLDLVRNCLTVSLTACTVS